MIGVFVTFCYGDNFDERAVRKIRKSRSLVTTEVTNLRVNGVASERYSCEIGTLCTTMTWENRP